MTTAPAHRDRRLGGSGRLAGVDLARGLAVLGMFAAHLLVIDAFDPWQPSTWVDVVNGRSSILFATVAGISIALMTATPGTAGTRPASGAVLSVARRRLAVRAAIIWAIGMLLNATGVPVYVILQAYGILFLLALPLVGLSARTLWTIAAAIALVAPWLLPVLDGALAAAGPVGGDLVLLLGWHYPFPLWAAFMIAGIAAARSDLRATRTVVALVAVGVGCAVAAGAASAVASFPPDSYLGLVLSDAAHSGGLLEAVGSGGFALAVIGLCLLVCRLPVASSVLLPIRAIGSMPLTAYVGQILVWAAWASLALGDVGDLSGFRALQPFWPFVVVTVVFCTAWALLLGRGPLERALALATRLAVPA
ncbi:DUF418 domain-containing protein [Microbacterium hominis]|uniref:DUF418 domain-containing protein n=1 Tax=Microbacterium hominis TaxID=162426 RepID=UPI000768732C|nr:heparan-alpha-glucosaminide N-acetyltransferase domain-containing protein [Microbacterium hominis]KXC06220.1 acyltransferase [Microbacterium hominis]